jgi:sodium/potassium/calcium exchanger 6
MDCLEEWLGLSLALVLTVVIALGTSKTEAPQMHVFWIYQMWSFIMSMMWLYMLANLIVDIVELFGIITGVSSILLGLTLLSWGNSVGDVFTSIAISKKGLGEMALTGCLAGPIFNIMLGAGVTTLKCN